MNPFENHTFEIFIPKQHVIEDMQIKEYNLNSSNNLPHNDNLLKLSNHSIFFD